MEILDTVEKFKRRIESFRNLEKDFDSYNSDPPSELAIENALKGLNEIDKRGLIPDYVDAGCADEIIMQVNTGECFEEWSFYSDGEILMMKSSFN